MNKSDWQIEILSFVDGDLTNQIKSNGWLFFTAENAVQRAYWQHAKFFFDAVDLDIF